MSVIFPSEGWLKAMEEKLNSDRQYANIAKNWEGNLKEQVMWDADAEAATVIPVWTSSACREMIDWRRTSLKACPTRCTDRSM